MQCSCLQMVTARPLWLPDLMGLIEAGSDWCPGSSILFYPVVQGELFSKGPCFLLHTVLLASETQQMLSTHRRRNQGKCKVGKLLLLGKVQRHRIWSLRPKLLNIILGLTAHSGERNVCCQKRSNKYQFRQRFHRCCSGCCATFWPHPGLEEEAKTGWNFLCS